MTFRRPDGGATQIKPQSDWDNRDLPVYFSRVPTFASRTATRYIPTATSTPTGTTNSTSSHHSSTAAIAGGAAGGGVGLLLLIALIWCCLRRRRKTKKGVESAPSPPETLQKPPEKIVPLRVELPANPPHELPSPDEPRSQMKGAYSHAQDVTRSHSQESYGSSQQPTSPFAAHNASVPPTPAPSYPSPVTLYGGYSQQGHYSAHSPPPASAFPTGAYHHDGSQIHYGQSPSPNNAHFPQRDQQYDASQQAYYTQHFPPPMSEQHTNPSATNTSYSDRTNSPPTATSTPAHFYPHPLNLPQNSAGGSMGRTTPVRGKFMEQEFH